MGDFYLKENRLFRIVYYVLEKEHVTAKELAKRFEVSVRTIYRDLDTISSVGIPIYAVTGRNGGIRINDSYVLNKALFSDKEKKDMLVALQSLTVIDNTYEKDLLTKLSALFNTQPKNWLEVDLRRWGNKTSDNTKFKLLKKAIIDHKVVSITYVASDYSQTKRKIHPLKLMYKAKEWYVKAFYVEKDGFRLFKINRIINCQVLNEHFVPTVFPELAKNNPDTYKKIVLRFPKEQAYRVYDDFDDKEVTANENGELVVSTKMPEDTWLKSYLLSFGSSVEVIEPSYLHSVLAEEAKKIYEKNKS